MRTVKDLPNYEWRTKPASFRCFHNEPGCGQPQPNVKHFPTCPINKLQQYDFTTNPVREQQRFSTNTVRGRVNAKQVNTSTDAAPVPSRASKPVVAASKSYRIKKNKQPPLGKEFQWTAYHRGSEAELRETAQRTLKNQ